LLIIFIDEEEEEEEEEEELLASDKELCSVQFTINNNVFVCAGDGTGSEQSMFISSRMDRLHKLHYCG
jgi:hypothetical protein